MSQAIVVLLVCLVSVSLACDGDCPTATNWPAYTPKCAKCAHNDLIFVMDQSQSILASNQWPVMHDFVVNVLGWTQANGTQQTPYGSHLGMYGNHVGFVLFNDTVRNAPLWSFLNTDPTQVLASIKAWLSEPSNDITGGLSNICLALQTAISDFQEFPRSVPRTLVLMTDGAPNTVSGDCTVEKLKALGGQLQDHPLNVQVLVVAVNGINGGPASFNYQALAAVATWMPSSQGVKTPLLWDLSNGLTLSHVRDALTSHMGCCDCYADIDVVAETTERAEGGDLSKLLSNLVNFTQGVYSHAQYALAITTFTNDAQTGVCPCANSGCGSPGSVRCQDSSCVSNYFHRVCPEAFNAGGVCELKGGHTSIVAGMAQADIAYAGCDRPSAPNVAVMLASGRCETSGDPRCAISTVTDQMVFSFKRQYPLRYILGIGGSGDVNWTRLQMLGEPANPWNTKSGLLNNGDSSWSTVASQLQQIPGMVDQFVKAQPGCRTLIVPTGTPFVSTTTPVPSSTASFCLEFVLDESGSISNDVFMPTVDNVASILKTLTGEASACGQSCGVSVFNDTARQPYPMGNCANASTSIRSQYAWIGKTDIYAGMMQGIDDMKTCASNLPKIMVLLTDGLCNVQCDTLYSQIPGKLASNNIKLLVVKTGVSNDNYLCTLAGGCDKIIPYTGVSQLYNRITELAKC